MGDEVAATTGPSKDELTDVERSLLERLKTIRVGKSKLLEAMGKLQEKCGGDEKTSCELMSKLVHAYDALKAQEEQFIAELQKRIELRGKESDGGDGGDGGDGCELEGLDPSEVVQIIDEAEKATETHDRLKAQIEADELKKAELEQLYSRATVEKDVRAKKLLEQVEFAKLRLTSESDDIDRKGKILERLRREAERRGYKKTTATTAVGDRPHQSKSNSASKADVKKLLLAEVPATGTPLEEFPDSERVPPPPPLAAATLSGTQTPSADDSTTADQLHATVSDRFVALKQRKQRMQELRDKLLILNHLKMDKTYNDAVGRLSNLTAMREKLEAEQLRQGSGESGEKESDKSEGLDTQGSAGSNEETEQYPALPSDDERSAQQKAGHNKQRSDFSGDSLDSPDGSTDITTDELINHVRETFESTFHHNLLPQSSTSFNPTASNSITLIDDAAVTAADSSAPCSPSAFETSLKQLLDGIEKTIGRNSEQLGRIETQASVTAAAGPSMASSTCRMDEARRHLNSGIALLEKQKALRRIHHQLDPSTSVLLPSPASSTAELLEQEVYSVMEKVVQWLSENDSDWMNETVIVELRHIILEAISSHYSASGANNDGPPHSMEQINNALDVTLGKYMGSTPEEAEEAKKDELVRELSETLFNELSFLHLMQHVNEFVSDASDASPNPE